MSQAPLNIDPPSAPFDADAFTLAYLQANEAECPACGYNVHALTQPRCPECSRTLMLRVVPAIGGISKAWVTSLVISALAAGIGLLVAAVVLRVGFAGFAGVTQPLKFILIYFMCHIPLPVMLLVGRRLFIRMNKTWQWRITVAFTLATGAVFVWFLLQI